MEHDLIARLGTLPELQAVRFLAGFWPMGHEPDVTTWLEKNHRAGTTILLPRVRHFKRSRIPGAERVEFARFEGRAELLQNRWGIGEPTGPAVPLPATGILLVPALAVSRAGTRLGHGFGYYDEIMDNHPGLLPICAVFGAQLSEDLPVEQHDRPVRVIITPEEVIRTDLDA